MDLVSFGWDSAWESAFAGLSDLPSGCEPARVARQDRGQYSVLTASGPCAARCSGRFTHEHARSEYPVVGDWVALEPSDTGDLGRIHAILPRRTRFARKAAGETSREQVVAANIDIVALVTGLDNNFNLRRIERYLAVAAASGAEPLIVLNKADLCPELEARLAEVEAVSGHAPVITVSALTAGGLDELRMFLRPCRTAALIGSSGVGKSTMLNALLGEERQDTQETQSDAKGRHTTTARELFVLPGGALLIDTPGMREIGLADESAPLEENFADLEELAARCRFSDCRHEGEPGCAIEAALDAGEVEEGRLASWFKLQRERAHAARLQDARLKREAAAEWRRRSMQYRQGEEFKRRNQ